MSPPDGVMMPPVMAGGRTQRFAREPETAPLDSGRLEVELLKRLEEQAEELTQMRSRAALLESAVDAERKARQHLGAELEAERAKAKQLQKRARRLSEAAERVPGLEDELARERTDKDPDPRAGGRGRLRGRRT